LLLRQYNRNRALTGAVFDLGKQEAGSLLLSFALPMPPVRGNAPFKEFICKPMSTKNNVPDFIRALRVAACLPTC
jgi:hypothetical protein